MQEGCSRAHAVPLPPCAPAAPLSARVGEPATAVSGAVGVPQAEAEERARGTEQGRSLADLMRASGDRRSATELPRREGLAVKGSVMTPGELARRLSAGGMRGRKGSGPEPAAVWRRGAAGVGVGVAGSRAQPAAGVWWRGMAPAAGRKGTLQEGGGETEMAAQRRRGGSGRPCPGPPALLVCCRDSCRLACARLNSCGSRKLWHEGRHGWEERVRVTRACESGAGSAGGQWRCGDGAGGTEHALRNTVASLAQRGRRAAPPPG